MMRRLWEWLLVVVAISSTSAGAPAAEVVKGTHTAAEVLLVVNADSPISKAIGKDYALKRGVTKIVEVHCADSAVSTADETISLANYTTQIAKQVSRFLKSHPEINFIVLTKGVPIRIDGGITGSRDEHTTGNFHPSVDSYLAAIDYPTLKDAVKIKIHGSGADGYGWLNHYWKSTVPFSHKSFGGYLVTRLDGYTQADAMALVDRSIKTSSGVGSTVDAPSAKVLLDVQPIFKIGDVDSQPLRITGTITDESDWSTWNADLVKAAALLKTRGIPYELDMNEAFVGDRSNLSGYFSWGSNDAKYSEKAYHSLRFAPGAIGDTAVSTSARTFLPTTGGQSLIIDLIAQGITGVKGYSDEPLLQAIASPSVLMDRYTSGFTLAESFYAASSFVGWTDIVVGDPLCRPASWSAK